MKIKYWHNYERDQRRVKQKALLNTTLNAAGTLITLIIILILFIGITAIS